MNSLTNEDTVFRLLGYVSSLERRLTELELLVSDIKNPKEPVGINFNHSCSTCGITIQQHKMKK